MLQPIENDVFCIAQRLRELNPEYRVLYNDRFEVHTNGLEFVVPFDTLDERTIEHAYKTRIENFDDLKSKMDFDNDKLSKSAKVDELKLADMMQYANSQVHEVVFGAADNWF